MQQHIAAPQRARIPVNHVESSSIAGWGYDPARKVLQVDFKDAKNPAVPKSYQYDSVPPELATALREAAAKNESVGSLINKAVVRGGFTSHKLEPQK